MAKKNVYAVKKGMVTGLFYNWDDCKAAVTGYPGAEYKGFATEAEARDYLGMSREILPERHGREIPEGQMIAYVDGSYEHSLMTYAYGCVYLLPGGEIKTESGSGQNPETAAIRNVAGEMIGAMTAVRWAIKNGYQSIEICYDYEGIEKWATGVWKAKMELTQKYAAYMREKAQKIGITFTKVAAHTGDTYNEQADSLAKEALVKEEEKL